MTIARTYIMIAKDGCEAEMKETVVALAAALKGIAGFDGVEALQDRKNPKRFIFVEKWADEDAQKAAGAHLPKEVMGRLMAAIDGAPDGSTYDRLA